MEVEINISSPSPVYQQIVDQIIVGVLSGALASGDTLPPIRQLAHDLSLNHNTVAKAYKQLESQRVIQTARRAGTFIREDAAAHCANGIRRNAETQLDELVLSFKRNGLSDSDITDLLSAQLDHIKG